MASAVGSCICLAKPYRLWYGVAMTMMLDTPPVVDATPPDDGEVPPAQPPVPSSSKCTICRERDLIDAPGWHGATGLMVCVYCDAHVCEMKCEHGPLGPPFTRPE